MEFNITDTAAARCCPLGITTFLGILIVPHEGEMSLPTLPPSTQEYLT